VRQFLNEVYADLFSSDASLFIDEAFLLSGGRTCYAAAPPQTGMDLIYWRFVASDFGGPPAPAYWWGVPP